MCSCAMMGVARASLLLSLLIYSLSLLPQDCSSQRPTTGVLLYLEIERDSNNGHVLSNNSLISNGSLSSDYGLACYSADDSSNTIGEWRFPDGSRVDRDRNDQQQLVFAHNQIGRVTLQIRDNHPFPSALEGVYSCLIPDETGTERALYAGVYSTTNYDNSAGPVVSSPVEFRLLSHAYDYPPTFSITCISTAFPPTTLEWRLNGSSLDLSSNSFSSSQQLRDTTSSTYYNILTVNSTSVGQYSCSVANDRGTNSANITVNAPSGAPTNTDVSSVGNNSVRVRWSPPADGLVRGYRVFYTDGSTTSILNISNALTTETVVRGLTLGVQYSITVQAFADFPSPNSTADNIMLNAPSTPQSVTVTDPFSSSLVVRWSSPSDGINGYEVSYTPVAACDGVPGGAVMVEGANTFTHTLQDLQAYTEYSITVRARGDDGLGPPSTARRQRTAADAPGPPQMVTVANGSSSSGISVRWSEPDCSDINDAGVTGYMISYGVLSERQRTIISHSGTTFTISGDGLQLFTEYSIQVAAVNSRGVGTYSQPKIGVITGAPGRVSSLSTVPDILSVVLNWDHPVRGVGHITQYEIRHMLERSLLGINSVSGDLTSYRVGGLQPDMQYLFEIRPYIGTLEGPSVSVIARTLTINRQVRGVSVRQLNSSAVNVSWSRFDSEDVFYRVFYSSPPGQADFSGNSSWGVIARLLQGQTQFQVAVVVNIQGVPTVGPRSDIIDTTDLYSAPMLNGGSNTSIIVAGTIVGVLLLLILLVVIIIVSSIIYSRSKSRHPKESIEMMKCEAYEAVKISSNIYQAEGDYETVT